MFYIDIKIGLAVKYSTMNLGGDDWPIYVSPRKHGIYQKLMSQEGITAASNAKGTKVNLKPGDMLYRGVELEHWREPLKVNYVVKYFSLQ